MGVTSRLYSQRAMRIDVDTSHQPHTTATINLCTYLATSGTAEHVDLQLLDSQRNSTVAIQRSPYFNVSLTLLPNVPSCDAITTWSHRMDHQVYLRIPIPSYRMR